MTRKSINAVLLTVVIILGVIWALVDPPLSSPLKEGSFSLFTDQLPKVKTQKIVYGFLPYWNLSSATLQPELTHLAYFSLTIDEDGSFITTLDDNAEPGYRRLQSTDFLEMNEALRKQDTQTHIVLSQFDNEVIRTFLADQAAQENFLLSLDSMLLAYPFTGVNLDIEYAGNASAEIRNQYTQFVQKVSQHLSQKYQGVELTVDVYAAAASKKLLWDIEKIAPAVDYIIIMAYDFHRSSSIVAGPVAPLFKKEASWSESINSYLKDFAKKTPPEKLLLGIPFYGYEWQTTAAEPGATTIPQSGATASYKRVKELLAQKETLGIEEHWDDDALAPYLSYTKDGNTHLVYYENPASVAYKLAYVRQLDLAGIAIWSLGYEGNSRDLWQSIDQVLKFEK